MLTREKAEKANLFHAQGGCSLSYGKRGRMIITVERWKRNGKTKTLVRTPDFYEIPVKHGMYAYSVIRSGDEDLWHTDEDCLVMQEARFRHSFPNLENVSKVTVTN